MKFLAAICALLLPLSISLALAEEELSPYQEAMEHARSHEELAVADENAEQNDLAAAEISEQMARELKRGKKAEEERESARELKVSARKHKESAAEHRSLAANAWARAEALKAELQGR